MFHLKTFDEAEVLNDNNHILDLKLNKILCLIENIIQNLLHEDFN